MGERIERRFMEGNVNVVGETTPPVAEVNPMYVIKDVMCFDINSNVVMLYARQNIQIVGGLEKDYALWKADVIMPELSPKPRTLWFNKKEFEESVVSPKQKGEIQKSSKRFN